jgi:membrane fusion protein (multidrug efflux system)
MGNINLYIFVVTGLLVLSGCESKTEKQAKPPPPQQIPIIEVMTMDVPVYQEYVGQVYGEKDIPVRARVEGFLESIHFEEGIRVSKGKLLYTIDSQPFEANVASYKSRVAEAQTELVRAEAELNRYEPLVEKNAVSKSDYDAAKAQYGAAVASVEAAEANLELAEIELGYCNIYSPITGIIGKTNAKVGEFVGRTPNPVILNTVSSIENIRVEFFISESEYLIVARGMRERKQSQRDNADKTELELILADGSTHPFKGKVDFADREIDPSTGSLLVQASFPNPDRLLRPGQFARIRALVETRKDAVVIPQRCVSELQGQFSVYTIDKDNKVQIRQVKPSIKINDLWVIEEGLESNEKILLEGIQSVRGGMKIDPQLTTFESKSTLK